MRHLLPGLLLLLPVMSPAVAAQPADVPAAGSFVPGEVIVQFKDHAGPVEEARALGRALGQVAQRVRTPQMQEARGPGLVRARVGKDAREAARLIAQDPAVEFAEPNYYIRHSAVSNDTSYTGGSMWGVDSDDLPTAVGPANTSNAYGSGAEEAWSAGNTGSAGVVVAVMDEGVAFDHPDLAGNAWTNPWDPVNGRDDDGNGYIDDVHGWDFINHDASTYDGGATATEDRHGTHVSGTIGAVGGNGAGVAGVCWQVRILSTKILGPNGGTTLEATQALDYLIDMKVRHGLNLVAVNNSWTSAGFSQAFKDSVLRAAKHDILMICAAGNDGRSDDTTPMYPASFDTRQGTSTQTAASYDAVISVAAIDRYGALATFSNFGATNVDLGAPGVSIVSTLPPASYGYYSGTSMACPHVTGAAALYASVHPGCTALEIRNGLLASVVPTASLSGKTVTGGRLSVSGFVPATHDGAVTRVAPPLSVVSGRVGSVQVYVANQGTSTDTFTVTLADIPPAGGRAGTVSGAQQVAIAPGGFRTLTFTWSTTGATVGAHALRGTVGSVAGETDLSDNQASGSSTVTSLAAPIVTGATPASMARGTTARMTVTGSGFVAGASVTFTGGTGPRPVASAATVAYGGASLTASVSVPLGLLSTPASWTLVVTNPDGQAGSKVGALRVI